MTITLTPKQLAVAVVGLIVLLATLAYGGYDQLAGSPSGGSQPAAVVQPTSAPAEPTATSAPAPSPTVPPTAAPVPTEKRQRTCDEIRASGYESDEERAYFLANCVANSGSSSGSTPPRSTPAPQPDRLPLTGSYKFIGFAWADEVMPVPYCVNPANMPVASNGQPILSPDAFAALVRRAFQTWEDIPTSSIRFRYTGFCDNDPFDFHDRVSTVGWGWLFSNAAGLADPVATEGTFVRQGTFSQVFEVDIVVDIRLALGADNLNEYLNVILPHILLHEAGHFLGLDHATEPCSVMSPSGVRPGLCQYDIEAASALYPLP